MENESVTIDLRLVKALLSKRLDERQLKMTKEDTLKVAGEYLRLFTVEAIHRSVKVAEKEKSRDPTAIGSDDIVVEPVHLKQVVTQLLLDF
mmetsp:Transcript_13874/g.17215  ORF Transcript_13874/g.17215 Transcript_13874/m.17215 type:complete len:91 (+) Transcript_13874:140-412(+)